MRRRRDNQMLLGLWLLAMMLGGPVASASASEYAPIDRPGPALTVSDPKLRASLSCSDDVATNPRPPVLMLPATTVTAAENYSWNWIPALRAQGFAVCTSDQVDDPQNMGDMQTRAEYLVYALRRVHELSGGKRISIIGHSQGGQIMRWPLRFWPDTRAMVGDVVGMAATNHGSDIVPAMCVPTCSPALWQQRSDSQWYKALNSGQESFAGIDYTEIYSRTDEFVQPNLDDTGSSSLHGGPGRISNIALQDICPADTSEHLRIGTTDPVAWAIGLDAITHDGPADEHRIDLAVCQQPRMPGVDPVTGEASFAAAAAVVMRELATAPKVAAEPVLRCYATATGCPTTASAFGARTLVTLALAATRIPAKGPVKVRVANRNDLQITGKLSGRTVNRRSVSRQRRIRLQARIFRVPAHATTTVKLKLPNALRRLLKRNAKLTLRLTASVKDPAGNTRTANKRVTAQLKNKRR
jgi:hypothetical protein